MTRLLLALAVVAVWIGLTTLAAMLTPQRLDLRHARLAVDTRIAYPVPRNPVTVEKATAKAEASTTSTGSTSVAPHTPRRYSTPGPTVARPRSIVVPGSGVERWRGLVAAYPDWDVALMLRIMDCESKGDPNAYNRSSATGLFQILGGPFDPAANVATAHSMWASRGTQPWYPSKGCWG